MGAYLLDYSGQLDNGSSMLFHTIEMRKFLGQEGKKMAASMALVLVKAMFGLAHKPFMVTGLF